MKGSEAQPVGRPSQVARYAPHIAKWLREDPAPSAVAILRRGRLAGYRGGKSALYGPLPSVAGHRGPERVRASTPNSAGIVLAGPAILVVVARAVPNAQLRQQRRARAVQSRVRVQRRRVGPALQQREPVGIHGALKNLELLSTRLLHHLRAASLVRLRELRALARYSGDCNDASACHFFSSVRCDTPWFTSGGPLPPRSPGGS